MMKIRVVIMFAIAQVALTREHASRRSTDVADVADQAIRCNRNTVTNGLSNMSQTSSAERKHEKQTHTEKRRLFQQKHFK